MVISKRVQRELVQATPATSPQPRRRQRGAHGVHRLPSKRSESQREAIAEKNKGRAWTAAEHRRFLEALEVYPSGPWKAIAEHVGTKNARQAMTHAQKYREKFERQQRGRRRLKGKKRKSKPTVMKNGTATAPEEPAQSAQVRALDKKERDPDQAITNDCELASDDFCDTSTVDVNSNVILSPRATPHAYTFAVENCHVGDDMSDSNDASNPSSPSAIQILPIEPFDVFSGLDEMWLSQQPQLEVTLSDAEVEELQDWSGGWSQDF